MVTKLQFILQESERMTVEKKEISKTILKRLPIYLSYLQNLPESAPPYISATTLAHALDMGEVQVRKDLAIVSDGGRPKVGYLRANLAEDIEQFLGYDNTDDAVLVGAGKLGQALMDHKGFAAYGLNILAGFDVAPSVERTDSGKPVFPMSRLKDFCVANKIRLGIITVPNDQAQIVCDQLISCGIKAIWNFAAIHLEVPEGILVQNEDVATSLAMLSMHLRAQEKK